MVTKYTKAHYSYDQADTRVAQHITKAAPSELKLGEGGKNYESWPSARRWRLGVFARRRLRQRCRFGVF